MLQKEKHYIMYKDLREERVEIFEDTKRLYQTNKKLMDSIDFSRQSQQVIAEDAEIDVPEAKYDTPAKVLVSRNRSLEAAQRYTGQKVCVLNFASATNAGGGVARGASAQEEAICRCSTLYPCISDDKVTSKFHNKHRNALRGNRLSALYNDDCIYTPSVKVFKSDTNHPELLSEDLWYEVDIISCAAPNLRSEPSNAMNPDSGNKAVSIRPSELLELHKKRMSRILDIASLNDAEVMVLGAFGCGAFQNPPNIVAQAMYVVIKDYLYHFKTIEFAVYCTPGDTKNYDAFKRVFSPICK